MKSSGKWYVKRVGGEVEMDGNGKVFRTKGQCGKVEIRGIGQGAG